MIYDCFTFFNENDILDLRLNIMSEIVDKFIIIEATKTHSGLDKPLNFDHQRFEKFKDKIIYVALDKYPEFKTSWTYENYQRNYIMDVLKEQNAKDDDVIIISDCDEIVSPDAIREFCKNPVGIKSPEQKFFYYYINLLNFKGEYWYGAKILTYKEFFNSENDKDYVYNDYLIPELNQGVTPTKIRMKTDCPSLKNGGWHMSFCGGADSIISKIKSFAHQEYNLSENLDKNKIEKLILEGHDIFGRKAFELLPVRIDSKMFHKYIIENQEKYDYLIFKVPTVYKLRIAFKILKNRLTKFLFQKRKDGTKRIVKICGVKFVYDKNNVRNKVGKHCKLKNVKLTRGLKIESDVSIISKKKGSILINNGTGIGKGTVISNYEKPDSKIIIGRNCAFGWYNNFYGQGGITIGNNVLSASNVCILTSNHGYKDIAIPIKNQESEYAPVSIGDDTWLGYNTIILSGVNIGKHCVIGAGSIVTKDIPDFSIAAGNPCRVIKRYNFDTCKWEKV